MKRRAREIAPGQRYRKIGPGGVIWEVVSVRTDASGAAHARMKSTEDAETFRTFATGALTDQRDFYPIDD